MLEVTIDGIDETKTVAQIDFIFRQKIDEDIEPAVTRTYIPNSTDEGVHVVSLEDGVYYLQFTEEESRYFKPDKTYFMDTRVIYSDDVLQPGFIPASNICKLYNMPTLFRTAGGGS